MLRTALRAAALRAALDPEDHDGPWEQEKRAGHRPAPPASGHKKDSPLTGLITKTEVSTLTGEPHMNETQVDTGIAELSGLTLGGRKLVFLDCARI